MTRKTGRRTLAALVGLGCTLALAHPAGAQSGLAGWDDDDERTVPAAPEASPSESPSSTPASPEPEVLDAEMTGAADTSADASAPKAAPEAKESDSPGARAMRDLRELEARNGFAPPPPENELEWRGSLQLDLAQAQYTFSEGVAPEETLYDFRGRFVVGPTVTHEFEDGYFLAARAEMVGWVRERENIYQVNVDDVYARFGKKGVWDVTGGRFLAWRVYHRGRGFDLFTVEDLGACKQGNCGTQNPNNFAVSMYEVDNIYMRGPYGRLAAHIYPTEWSGIELLGEYGGNDTINVLGGRAAAMVRSKYFRLSAAAEYREVKPTTIIAPEENGVAKPCPKCNTSNSYGFGGGVELTPVEWLELGFSAAHGEREAFNPLNGNPELEGTGSVSTYGGYGELDVGSFVGRSFLVGGGAHWTQENMDSGNYDSHLQMAAFLAYPLGFNSAELKLVFSRAELDRIIGSTNAEPSSTSNAVRLRLLYPF